MDKDRFLLPLAGADINNDKICVTVWAVGWTLTPGSWSLQPEAESFSREEERKYKYVDILAAILVTGGALLTGSVEVLTSEGQPWCSLPDLPSVRSRHTQARHL